MAPPGVFFWESLMVIQGAPKHFHDLPSFRTHFFLPKLDALHLLLKQTQATLANPWASQINDRFTSDLRRHEKPGPCEKVGGWGSHMVTLHVDPPQIYPARRVRRDPEHIGIFQPGWQLSHLEVVLSTTAFDRRDGQPLIVRFGRVVVVALLWHWSTARCVFLLAFSPLCCVQWVLHIMDEVP